MNYHHIKETVQVPKLVNFKKVPEPIEKQPFPKLELPHYFKNFSHAFYVNLTVFVLFVIFFGLFLYNCKYGIFKSEEHEPMPMESILRV